MTTPQVEFWRGDFGNAYTDRNALRPELMRARTMLWSEILRVMRGDGPRTILEVGANIGVNLRALSVLTDAHKRAVEPNDTARAILVEDNVVAADDARPGTAASIPWPNASADLVFTSGVLIHIHPDHLEASMRDIHRVSSRWVLSIEYFSDRPEEVRYRGHEGVLFKRDFGGMWLDLFPDLKLADCGFCWKRETGLDNLTWWLFRKPV